MLEEVFQEVYTKFKLHFYQSVFQRFATRIAKAIRVVMRAAAVRVDEKVLVEID